MNLPLLITHTRRLPWLAALLLWVLSLVPRDGQAQLYYTVSDNSTTTTLDEVRRSSLSSASETTVANNFANVTGVVVVDVANNRLLIADTRNNASKIVAVNLATNTATTFLTIGAISGGTGTLLTGLAVDNTNGYLYYSVSDNSTTTTLDELRRVPLAGGSETTLVSNHVNVAGPLALDLPNNRILVADTRNNASKIVAVNLATNAATTFLTPGAISGSTNTLLTGITTVPTAAPTVTTAAATSVTTTSAGLGGNVTADGGATVTDRGVVYSTTNTIPTTADTKVANGSGTGTFSATVSSLAPGTTYYVRAYATNLVGTSYGAVISFTTTPNAPVVIVPANSSFVNTTTPTYGGTALASSTVTVYVDGAAIGTTTANSAGNWAITQPTALSQGSHTVYATAQTSGSAVSANSATNTFTVDTVRPSVAISSSAGASGTTTTTTPIPFTVTFSESVTGFVQGDLTVSNGTVSGFSGSGTTYTFTVTAGTAGTATTVNVAANVAQDQAGNGNTAASAPYSLTYQPTATVTSVTRLNPSPTATAQVSYRVVFSGSVTGLTVSNFSLTTTGSVSGASVSSVSGSGTTYTVAVNTGTGNGSLRLNVATGTGVSPTVTNTPYTAGEVYTITKSFAAAPQLTIVGTGGTGSDVTAFVDVVQVLSGGAAFANALQNGSFEIYDPLANGDYGYSPTGASWTFNSQSGIAETGSAFTPTTPVPNGIAVAFVQSNGGNNGQLQQTLALPTGSSYQVSFQAAQRVCCTTLDQALNVFLNGVFIGTIQPNSNGYTTFTSATFSVTAPALTATVSTTSASPTGTAPIPFSVSFSQSVGTTFVASDVTVAGGTLTSGSFAGSGAGPYSFTVTPAGTGTVTVSLAAGVATDANNTQNAASNAVSVQYNQPVTAAPVVTSPANGGLAATTTPTYTGTAPAGSTVTVYVDGSSIGTTTATGGSFSLLQPTALAQGPHTVYATAQTSGSAVSANSATNTFTVDSVRPTVAISSSAGASGGTTATSPLPFTVTFSEPVTGFVAGDVTVTNGTITGNVVNGSGTTYTFTVTPTTPGTATTVYVPANVAQDQAGNFNTAAPAAYALTFQAPTITVAPATLPNGAQGTAYSQTLSASGGSGSYAYAITGGALPAGLSLNLTTGTIAGTPTTSGTFTFTVTATDNSAAPGPYSGSRTYTLSIAVTAVVWTGAVNTDWFTASNWSPGQVPDATIDVTIPTAPSGNRFPTISSSTANARNLTLNSGATLTQTGGTLALAANLINNGAFQPTGGTVSLGGTTLTNILGSSNTRFWNLTIGANGAQSSTSASTSVQRLLTLNGNFATNGNPFTLESTTANTALVVNNGSNVIVGNTTVQRYIAADVNPNLGYRHISAPISNATVASLTTGSFAPVLNPAYNTSATPTQERPFPTVYGYDQSRLATTNNNLPTFDKGWFSPAALSDALTVGQGYTVNLAAAQTWNFVGAPNNGTVTQTLARNSGATAADAGLQLVGNPYPSPLDWSLVVAADRPNLDAIMYVFASDDPTNPYTGTYRFYQGGIGNISPVLPLGQGFFVRVSAGQTSGTLSLKNSHRVTSYTNPTYHRTAETRPVVHLTLQGAGKSLTDDAFVYFDAGATNGFDAQYDGMKLVNPSGLNLSSSISATERLCVNGLAPLTTTQRIVPLAVGVPATGSYTLNAAEVLNLATTPVYLRDLQSGAVVDLAQQPSYQFTVTNASVLITGRFELVFSPSQPLATAPAALTQQVALYPNPAKKAAFVELPASLGRQAVTATLVDALGREVRTATLPAQGATAHQLDLTDLTAGVYALRLSTSAGVVVKKLVVE